MNVLVYRRKTFFQFFFAVGGGRMIENNVPTERERFREGESREHRVFPFNWSLTSRGNAFKRATGQKLDSLTWTWSSLRTEETVCSINLVIPVGR